MTTESILKLPQVCSRTGFKRSSIYLKVKTGEFPAPIKLGPQASGWLSSEVDGWIADRIKASRSPVRVTA